MATKTAQENWKGKKRAAGFRDVLVWLTPEAATALESLRHDTPGASINDLVSRAVILAAGMDLAETAGHVTSGPDSEVVGIKDQLAAIEKRLARVEASTTPSATVIMPVELVPHDPGLEAEAPQVALPPTEQEPDHQDQDGGAEGEPARCRKRNGQADHATLLEAVADKLEQVGGWDFNVTALYRELEAKGVKVHGHARNFCSWVTKHRAAVEAILDQRRADRGEG